MERWPLILVAGAALLVAGCEQKNKKTEPLKEEPAPAPLANDNMGATDPYASDPLLPTDNAADTRVTTPPPAKSSGKTAKSAAAPATSGRTHVVAKGDTLSSIARKYYGDSSKWKTIFNANRNRISDPNRLTVGTKLIIP